MKGCDITTSLAATFTYEVLGRLKVAGFGSQAHVDDLEIMIRGYFV